MNSRLSPSSTTPILERLKLGVSENGNTKQKLPENYFNKLKPTKTLRVLGEDGCGMFHCLDWNGSGNLLASGNRFGGVALWDPSLKDRVRTVQTWGGSLKEVKFLAGNDSKLLGSISTLRLSVVDLATSSLLVDCYTTGGSCLRIHKDEPSLIWLCNNDNVEEIDLRKPVQAYSNAFLRLEFGNLCLDINPIRSEMLAVGTSFQVKLFDRRFINKKNSNKSHSTLLTPDCSEETWRCGIRELQFNQDGSELLANYGNGDVHLFDIYNSFQKSKRFTKPPFKYDYLNLSDYMRLPKFFGDDEELILTVYSNELHVFQKSTTTLINQIKMDNVNFYTLKPNPDKITLAAIRDDQQEIVILSPNR